MAGVIFRELVEDFLGVGEAPDDEEAGGEAGEAAAKGGEEEGDGGELGECGVGGEGGAEAVDAEHGGEDVDGFVDVGGSKEDEGDEEGDEVEEDEERRGDPFMEARAARGGVAPGVVDDDIDALQEAEDEKLRPGSVPDSGHAHGPDGGEEDHLEEAFQCGGGFAADFLSAIHAAGVDAAEGGGVEILGEVAGRGSCASAARTR